MKITVVLAVLVAVALASPQRRDGLNPIVDALLNLFHVDHIKALVTDLLDELGGDEHEHECESDCGLLVKNQVHQLSLGVIGSAACPLVCHSFQELVHFFHLTPPATTLAPGAVPT